ncbi:MAG: glycosyltransferase family 39 protein [Aggregatilineales bacterium]
MFEIKHSPFPSWWLGVPILLGSLMLLLLAARVTYLHHDELLVYHFTRLDLGYAIWYQGHQDVHPPLWFAFFWVWQRLVGTTELAGRLQGIFFALLTLAVVWRLGRDWFRGWAIGAAAAAILAANAYFVTYALEIRPYAAILLLAALSMWVFERWQRSQSWRTALVYGALIALMFYVHYFLIFLVIVQVGYFLIGQPLTRRRLSQGVAAAAFAFALWLPWFPTFIGQVILLRELSAQAGIAYASGLGTPHTTAATNLATIQQLAALAFNGQTVLYAVVLAAAIAQGWRQRRLWLAVGWGIGVPALALAVNLFAAVYAPRYIAYLTGGLALLLAVGLLSSWSRWRAFAFGVFFIVSLWGLPDQLPERAPLRDIFRALSAAAAPGDVVYFQRGGEEDDLVNWNAAAYLWPEAIIQRGGPAEAVAGARRVWFITGELLTEPVQQIFLALERTHPVQQVIGDCKREWCYVAQLMEAPPLADPIRFIDVQTGDALLFLGADIDAIEDERLRLRLWWTVETPAALDYSFAVHVVDEDGTLIAQADGPLVHYGVEIVPTSQIAPHQIIIDHRAVELPRQTAAKEAALALIVYRSWDGQRLLLESGADHYSIDLITNH